MSLAHQAYQGVTVVNVQIVEQAIKLLVSVLEEDVSEDAVSRAVALLLDLIPRGEKIPELFYALLKHAPWPSTESVALREGPDSPEVYLTQRPEEDPYYPGQWHCPGRMLRNMETIEEALRGLAEEEYGVSFDQCFLVEASIPPDQERNQALLLIHLVTLTGEPTKKGQWFPVDKLPEPMVAVHRDVIIPMALSYF